jgi:hypothetical protein
MKITFTLIAAVLLSSVAIATPKSNTPPKVSDVAFSVHDGKVIIKYTLAGNVSAKYRVSVNLKRKSDPSYEYWPAFVTGDVGEGRFVGRNREIVWEIKKDFPGGVLGDDYYFVVEAEEVAEEHGTTLMTWIGSGIALAAATIACIVLLSSKSVSSNSSTSGLPVRPGKP